MWRTMGGDATADRLAARATRLDAFARRLADELDAYVRRRAKELRDDYQRAGLSIGKRDDPGPAELAYTVEIIVIQPGEDGEESTTVTLDLTAKITETEAFGRLDERRRAALEDAARFRRLVAATENGHADPRQTTIAEYLN